MISPVTSFRRTGQLIVILAIVGAAMSVLASTAPAASRLKAADCAATPLIVGIRGSGEPKHVDGNPEVSFGSPLQALANNLFDNWTGRAEVETIGLDYPAVKVTNWKAVWYGDSVGKGTRALVSLVRRTVTACARRSIVILGYSQGANVFHDAAADLADRYASSIKAVVLFGSPLFNPKSFAATRSAEDPSFSRSRGGVITTGSEFPTVFRGRIQSYCHALDIICQAIGGGSNTGPHLTYGGRDAVDAAAFVARKLGLSRRPLNVDPMLRPDLGNIRFNARDTSTCVTQPACGDSLPLEGMRFTMIPDPYATTRKPVGGCLRGSSTTDRSGTGYLLGCPLGRYLVTEVHRDDYQWGGGIIWQPGNVWYHHHRETSSGPYVYLTRSPSSS